MKTFKPPRPRTEQGPAPKTKTYTVIDTTANGAYPSRSHEIIVGDLIVGYDFTVNEPTAMSYAHAMKFLKTEEFHVFDPDGKRIKRAPDVTISKVGGDGAVLSEDQCVAEFDELMADALLSRAAQLPGGESLSVRSGKAKVIAFLKAQTAAARRQADIDAGKVEGLSTARVDGGDSEEMSEADVDTFFDDEEAA